MKICAKCKEEKPLSEFSLHRKGKPQPYCKPCNREYNRQHYVNNKESYLEDAKLRRLKMRRRALTFVMEHAKGGCEECGETDFRCLEFDHVDRSTKSFEIGQAVSNGASNKKLLEEIKKCRVLCANCHKKHTANQMGWYSILNE
jgi:hypothetical protein